MVSRRSKRLQKRRQKSNDLEDRVLILPHEPSCDLGPQETSALAFAGSVERIPRSSTASPLQMAVLTSILTVLSEKNGDADISL